MMWLFDIIAQHFRRNTLTVKPFIKLHYLAKKEFAVLKEWSIRLWEEYFSTAKMDY